jgi:release factor glutamine methyltransferase
MPNCKTISQCLQQAEQTLKASSASPRLDAEWLLLHSLQKPHYYLYAHNDASLTVSQLDAFNQSIARRQAGEPVAYILGEAHFWTLRLTVNRQVLIPRPETELLVELLLQHLPQSHARVAELGTGSGAIALALASEQPDWQIAATEYVASALQVARHNQTHYGYPNLRLYQGSWLEPLPKQKYHAIVSNPPYIGFADEDLQAEVKQYQPHSALFAGEQGLQALAHIIAHSPAYLKKGGILMLEHGAKQGDMVRYLFSQANYSHIQTQPDGQGHERVSFAFWD